MIWKRIIRPQLAWPINISGFMTYIEFKTSWSRKGNLLTNHRYSFAILVVLSFLQFALVRAWRSIFISRGIQRYHLWLIFIVWFRSSTGNKVAQLGRVAEVLTKFPHSWCESFIKKIMQVNVKSVGNSQ